MITLYATQKKRHRCIEQTFGLWEKARVACSERIALKQVYYQGWNRPLAQVGCMRQVFGAGALGRPRGMGWGGRRERGLGWGIHVNPWLIHVNVWQKPLKYCKVISLQLIKINRKKRPVLISVPTVIETNLSHCRFLCELLCSHLSDFSPSTLSLTAISSLLWNSDAHSVIRD